MNPGQREMRSQVAELALAGIAIWQLGKRLFKKNEKGEHSFFSKAAILVGAGAGLHFLSQGWLGKGLGDAVNGLFNGGKDWEDLRRSFGAENTEYVNRAITQPMQALHLFGGLRVEEAQNLLNFEPKSQLYPYLYQKYSQASPKNEQALMLLEKMDKSDPSQELHQYLLALIPAGKLSTSYQKMKIEDLAEVRAGNMKALDFYLKEHPELELNPDKKDILLEQMKSDQDFLTKDLDQLVQENFFIKSEQYTTAFEAQVNQFAL